MIVKADEVVRVCIFCSLMDNYYTKMPIVRPESESSFEIVPCDPGRVEELTGIGGLGLYAPLGEEDGAIDP